MKNDYPILALCANLDVSPQRLLRLAPAAHLPRPARRGQPSPGAGDSAHPHPKPANLWQSAPRRGLAPTRAPTWSQPRRPAHEGRRLVRSPEGALPRPDHRQQARPTQRAQPSGPSPQGHRPQPTLGGRHHLYRNSGRRALSRRHPRPLQPQDRRLGHARAH